LLSPLEFPPAFTCSSEGIILERDGNVLFLLS